MEVLDRPYMSLVVIERPLTDFVIQLCAAMLDAIAPQEVNLRFPTQPYHTKPEDLPMVLWSPSIAQHLTAFMPSVMSGDYFVGHRAAKDLALDVLSVRTTPQIVQSPINEFISYSAGKRQRAIRAMLDGERWQFWQDGPPLPFEDTQPYSARRKRDRLTRERVIAYADAWGAPINDPKFWSSQSPAVTFASNDA